MNKFEYFMACLISLIFGCVFGWVGIALTKNTVIVYLDWRTLQTWTEVPAEIVSVQWNESRHTTHSEHRDSYEVKAEYRYTFRDQTFIGNRVNPFSRNISNPETSRRIYEMLLQHKEAYKPFHCYVNPASPQESVLFRDMDAGNVSLGVWGSLAFLIFAGAALSLPWFADRLYVRGPIRPLAALSKFGLAEGNQAFVSSTKHKLWFAVVFAGGSTLLLLPSALFYLRNASGQNNQIIVAGVLFAFYLPIVTYAFLRVRLWRRFGESALQLPAPHALIGEDLHGVLYLRNALLSEQAVRVSLSCSEIRNVSESATRVVLWETSRTISLSHTIAREPYLRIPLAFPIPSGLPPTGPRNQADGRDVIIAWILDVRVKTGALPYRTRIEFPVCAAESKRLDPEREHPTELAGTIAASDTPPVYRTESVEQTTERRESAVTAADTVPRAPGLTITPLADGYRLEYSRRRMAPIGFVLAIPTTCGAYFFYQIDLSGKWIPMGFFAFLSGCFLVGSIKHLLVKHEANVGPHALVFRREILGFRRIRTIERKDLLGLQPEEGPIEGTRRLYRLRFMLGKWRSYTWRPVFPLEEAQKLIALIQASGESGL